MFDLLKNKLGMFSKKLAEDSKEEPSRELKANISLSSKVKSVVTGEIEIRETEIEDMLFEFELSLLEADVNQETAKMLSEKIKEELVGRKIPRGQIQSEISLAIKQILKRMISVEQKPFLQMLSNARPFKILFLGPNGAGKTTSIAKLTNYLQKNNLKCILAASDTFRAASIEQLEKHASRLNVRVIKHEYGSDPAAVAFDAVKAAESKNIDIVLIDSAGRQETNKNLIEELKKMERVIKPDLKIFVGESLAGKNLLDQAKSFDKAIGIDGFILTKIDTDTKGGTIISLLAEIQKPVFFIGTGQEYSDFEEFSPDFIIERVL